jgi:hypothetical protein
MATIAITRNMGMLTLAIWLILHGLTILLTLAVPLSAMAGLAIIAGVLILIGR